MTVLARVQTMRWPVSRSELRKGLGPVAFESLRPLSAALLGVCFVVVAIDALIRDSGTAARLSLGTGLFAVTCLAVHLALRRLWVSEQRAHALTAVCAIGGVLLVLFRAFMIPGPLQLTGLTVTIIASGLFILGAGWLALTLGAALIGWEVIAWIVPSHSLDTSTTLLLLGGACVSIVAHVLRVHTFERQEALRLHAEQARSEAENAAAALRKSEAQTRAIIETASDAVIGFDRKNVVTRWNKQAEAMFGWTAREALGRPYPSLVLAPEHREEHDAMLAGYDGGSFEATRRQRIEVEVLHRDGHTFPVEIAITPLGSGERITFNGFVRDMSVRRAVESTIREEAHISGVMARLGYELIEALNASDLLQRLCRLTSEVLECDFSHTILLDNKSEEYVPVAGHGDTPEQWDSLRLLRFPGVRLLSALGSLKRETIMSLEAGAPVPNDALRRLLAHYEVTSVVFIALRRAEEVIGIQTAGYRSPEGSFSESQLRLARELAHVASLALQNVRLVEELQRANRVKSEFVATMSHELRTPLNVVLGYNELLLDGAVGPLSAQQTDILERSNRSAQQLLELITTTLDLSRLETGRAEIDPRWIDLTELAAEIDAEMRLLQGDKPGVAVRWNISADLPTLLTDHSKVKLILKNLLGNALKFTDVGEVQVTAQPTKEGVEIVFADSGIGIPADALSNIFEPFRQVDGSSTRRYGGVGLGLYIVHRLVNMLGGEVSVESKVGQGSTFRVWLPERVTPLEAEDGDDVGSDAGEIPRAARLA